MSTQKNEFLCSCQCNKRLKILFWVYSIFSYLKISQWLKNYYYPNLKAYYTYTFYALILWITHRHFAYLCRILTGIVNSWSNLLGCEQLLKTFLFSEKGICRKNMFSSPMDLDILVWDWTFEMALSILYMRDQTWE